MRKIAVLSILIFSSVCFADLDQPIREGTSITVESYDPKTKTYSIIMNEEREVGPNIATPEALARALDMPDLTKRKSDQITGAIYVLKKKLTLLSEKEVEKRKKK